jgi:hypothetical protein
MDKPDLIESAMARVGRKEPPPLSRDRNSGAAPETGRREYDRALSARLTAIESALGTNIAPSPSAAQSKPQDNHQYRQLTLFATACIGAIIGVAGYRLLSVGMAEPTAPIDCALTSAQPPASASAPMATNNAASVAPPAALTISPATAPESLIADSDVKAAIEGWRVAWQNRDAENYLAAYSPSFLPSDGRSRAAWVDARREALTRRGPFEVQLLDLQLTPAGKDAVRADFIQDFRSPRYREAGTPKTLELRQEQGLWRIVSERTGGTGVPAGR